MDLSGNPKLRVLNCNGSTKSGYGTLSSINLSYTSNLETLNLKNNKLEAINVTNLVKLTELDLSGNPGANFKIPAGIFNNLTTTKNKGVEGYYDDIYRCIYSLTGNCIGGLLANEKE